MMSNPVNVGHSARVMRRGACTLTALVALLGTGAAVVGFFPPGREMAPAPAPQPPSDLQIVDLHAVGFSAAQYESISQCGKILTWTRSPGGASGYEVSVLWQGVWTVVGDVPADVHACVLGSVYSGASVRIRAYNLGLVPLQRRGYSAYAPILYVANGCPYIP